ncbi:hypothetical protein PHET_06095 [Paragonimus heterotremus]|uniref:Uncharacterized protein n=1 Tax=Paragonimus heterotremus TaxID=100268 RepID=A0A8J4WGD1_9TREM|nr:hypothetical protein PHET_06095 [Paragonimus heterotremus]
MGVWLHIPTEMNAISNSFGTLKMVVTLRVSPAITYSDCLATFSQQYYMNTVLNAELINSWSLLYRAAWNSSYLWAAERLEKSTIVSCRAHEFLLSMWVKFVS